MMKVDEIWWSWNWSINWSIGQLKIWGSIGSWSNWSSLDDPIFSKLELTTWINFNQFQLDQQVRRTSWDHQMEQNWTIKWGTDLTPNRHKTGVSDWINKITSWTLKTQTSKIKHLKTSPGVTQNHQELKTQTPEKSAWKPCKHQSSHSHGVSGYPSVSNIQDPHQKKKRCNRRDIQVLNIIMWH